jgi:hypothetical protein
MGVAFDDAEGFLFIDLEPEGWESHGGRLRAADAIKE